MNLKRTTIVAVGCAALAAWFSAAMTPGGRPPVLSDAAAPGPIEASGADLASEIARLHERLRPERTPREPTRNPFAFRSTRRGATTSRVPIPAAASDTASPVPVTQLSLTLAGLAEDPVSGPNDTNGGFIRTAIISGNGQLFLAKEGDTVTDRGIMYRVGNISTDSVELTDSRDGTVHRLALR